MTDSFGSGILVPGYGFVLNDTNINFNLTPVKNDATGNPGANDPGPVIGTGSLGAKFIPSVVLQVVVDAIDFAMPIQDAVDAPRFWGQNAVGDFAVNPGLSSVIFPLRALGHANPWSGNVNRTPTFPGVGSMNSFAVGDDSITLYGAADAARRPDASAAVVSRG